MKADIPCFVIPMPSFQQAGNDGQLPFLALARSAMELYSHSLRPSHGFALQDVAIASFLSVFLSVHRRSSSQWHRLLCAL